MTNYIFQARDSNGNIITSTIQAESLREAARTLAGSGLLVLSLKPQKQSSPSRVFSLRQRMLRHRYPVIFSRQMAVMLTAGLSVSEALKILLRQDSSSAQHAILESLSAAVDNGSSLSDAMKNNSAIFPPTMISLIAAGETSGSLDTIFTRLSRYLESSYAAQEKLLTVMIYPFILLLSALSAAGVIIFFVLPAFFTMFESFHTPLPLPTRILLTLSSVLHNYGILIIIALFLTGFVIFRLYRQKQYRRKIDRLRLKLPVVGNFFAAGELLRISSTLSILLCSGIIIDKALELLLNVTENTWLRQLLAQAKGNLLKGYPLSETMRQDNIFPSMYLELLASGEATGEIDTVLDKIADACRLDLETFYHRLQSIAEPAMIFAVSLLIVPLVLAIALPILDTLTLFS